MRKTVLSVALEARGGYRRLGKGKQGGGFSLSQYVAEDAPLNVCSADH